MNSELRNWQVRLDEQAREIQRLKERQRWAGVALLAGLCLMGASPRQQAAVPDCITAKRFAVVDSNGRQRSIWTAEDPTANFPGGASLLFMPNGSDGQITLSTNAGKPYLALDGAPDVSKGLKQGHIKIGVDGTRGPHVILWGQNDDAFSASADTTARSCELRVPWDQNTHCLILEKGDQQQWAVP